MKRYISTFFAVIVLSSIASADSFLIKDAKIHTMGSAGTLSRASILIEDGVVTAMGTQISGSPDTKVIQATDFEVTPGLFNGLTQIGVAEVSSATATVDFVSNNEAITSSLRVADAFNPMSVYIPLNRVFGLTKALIVPQSKKGLFAGQAMVVNLSGATDGSSIVKENAGVVVSLGEKGVELGYGSRAAIYKALTTALDDARDYAQHLEEFLKRQRREYSLSKNDLEALQPVLRREVPLIVEAHRASDIRLVLKLAKKQDIRVVIFGAEEAWMLADELARSRIAVIIDPLENLPQKFELLGARLDNAAILAKAGVKMLFIGGINHSNAYLVRQSAGNGVANGLDKTEALKVLFSNASEIFDFESSEIRVGSKANFVLWDGDALDVLSSAKMVFIAGKEIPLVSRATRLRDKYLIKHGLK